MQLSKFAHPVLTCAQAREYEASFFEADGDRAWAAMQAAGREIGAAILRDFQELRKPPERLRVLALIGKGNNGGDAMLACEHFLAEFPRSSVTLVHAAGQGELGPLAARAHKRLPGRAEERWIDAGMDVAAVTAVLDELGAGQGFDICIDGLLGMSFQPPVRAPMRALIDAVNAWDGILLRAAVDLPSGVGDESDDVPFRADFTYATGIAKRPVMEGRFCCGRIRYLDLGFFDSAKEDYFGKHRGFVTTTGVLEPLRRLRPSNVDKRKFGHLFIVGGSAFMPGALLMAAQAAVRSGVGLVTVFAPASVAAVLAAQVPEAMWVPWPETANGTLSPRAIQLFYERMEKASALLLGPGLGSDRFTEMLAQEFVKEVNLPIVLDADALRLRAIEVAIKRSASAGPVILTPHAGEFMRISRRSTDEISDAGLLDFCRSNRVMTVLKGPITRICDGKKVFCNTFGGPVLSRGGSGDLLSGIIGGMLAQRDDSVVTSIARGVILHGLAAQHLARDRGQVAVHTTALLEYLPGVLRAERVE